MIIEVAKLVKKVLEEVPETRNSDMKLYLEVCHRINPDVMTKTFVFVIGHLKELGLPNTETVRRTRQKIQAEYENLRADKDVEAARMLLEEEFRSYATEVI